MPTDFDAGMASTLAVVRAIKIRSLAIFWGRPAPSKTKTRKLLPPIFPNGKSKAAPFLRGIRPDDQPGSRLSIWNSAPEISASPNLATIFAFGLVVRAIKLKDKSDKLPVDTEPRLSLRVLFSALQSMLSANNAAPSDTAVMGFTSVDASIPISKATLSLSGLY